MSLKQKKLSLRGSMTVMFDLLRLIKKHIFE